MSGGERIGVVVLSIDLELEAERQQKLADGWIDAVQSRLLAMTKEAALPAAWAVADPMLSAATESILGSQCGHEIAVVGDRAWLGPGCGRERLGRELARRFSAPRKAGIPVSTLALRNVGQVADLDLLVAHGVTAFCWPAVDQVAEKNVPLPARFGLWQPPAAWRLPLTTKWGLPAGWATRRQIMRAIRQRSMLHLRLDAAALVKSSDRALEVVADLFQYLAVKRDAGQLVIRSINELAAESLMERAAVPSRSILRPAA